MSPEEIKKIKEEYFRSLIAPAPVKKKRSCLKCKRVFQSDSAGHRICCFCVEKNQMYSTKAEEAYI